MKIKIIKNIVGNNSGKLVGNHSGSFLREVGGKHPKKQELV
jgi:hypothetical protein